MTNKQTPPKDMMQQLRDDAAVGLDMSPGDPTAAWAVGEIERLQNALESMRIDRDCLALRAAHKPGALNPPEFDRWLEAASAEKLREYVRTYTRPSQSLEENHGT